MNKSIQQTWGLGSMCVFILLFSNVNAQQVRVSGQLFFEHPVRVIYLHYTIGETDYADSTCLVNDHFQIVSDLKEIANARLVVHFDASDGQPVRHPQVKQFYIEPGEISIFAKDTLQHATITGSKAQSEYEQVLNILQPYQLQQLKVSSEIFANMHQGFDHEVSKSRRDLFQLLEQQKKDEVFLPYVQNNPDSPIALAILKQYAGFDFDADIVEPLFERLPERVQQSASGIVFRRKIDIAKKTGFREIAPPFTMVDTVGVPVSLDSFRGQYVLLDFWASWCAPCRRENPNIVKAFHAFGDRNFTVLGISLDTKKELWIQAIYADNLYWTNLSDLKGKDNAAALLYGITNIPQNFLIDPEGRIIAKNIKGEALHTTLDSLLPRK